MKSDQLWGSRTPGYALLLALALGWGGTSCRSRQHQANEWQREAFASSRHTALGWQDSTRHHLSTRDSHSWHTVTEELEAWQGDSLTGYAGSWPTPPSVHSVVTTSQPPRYRWRRVYRSEQGEHRADSTEARGQATALEAHQQALRATKHDRQEHSSQRSSAPLAPSLWWLHLALWSYVAYRLLSPQLRQRLSALPGKALARLLRPRSASARTPSPK